MGEGKAPPKPCEPRTPGPSSKCDCGICQAQEGGDSAGGGAQGASTNLTRLHGTKPEGWHLLSAPPNDIRECFLKAHIQPANEISPRGMFPLCLA